MQKAEDGQATGSEGLPRPQERREQERHPSLEEGHRRKERVLKQGTPSVVTTIADAVVIKSGNLFFLSERDGNVPLGGEHGFGLYYHDCRYVSGYELWVGGAKPKPLVANAVRGSSAVFQLTNPDLELDDGGVVYKEKLGIRWTRVIDEAANSLRDELRLRNFGSSEVRVPVALEVQPGFQDIFAVRSLIRERPGKMFPPADLQDGVRFVYEGGDGLYRGVAIRFNRPIARREGSRFAFLLELGPREEQEIQVTVQVAEAQTRDEVEQAFEETGGKFRRRSLSSLGLSPAKQATLESTSLLLAQVFERSIQDLRLLRSSIEGQEFVAAGIPWFATLFGRDSLIAGLQMLAYDPALAEETLRLLSRYQGSRVDEWRDEQPGKMPHELRVGELARMGNIPHTPYYGTIDATPLFLIVLCRHASWTGTTELFIELREHVERALRWMADHGDADGDGYIEYQTTSGEGLANQGWKDSGDAILNQDGSLATPPIALVEVQAYAYLAKVEIAELFRRTGELERAEVLRREAEELRRRFNVDYWLEDLGIYALARQAKGRKVSVVSSNPGHALWAGICDEPKAGSTVRRMMNEDMFSGWGIRTLSEGEHSYNPIGYHLGTVWPHDNAFAAAGFRRYGYDHAASRVFRGLVETAIHFEHRRLPELFAGFARSEFGVPVRYPVACHPQAWAAGSIPFLLQTMLGLEPQAFERVLRVNRPMLPDFVNRLTLRGLQLADGAADLMFHRASNGETRVEVLGVEGDIEVEVDPGAQQA